MPNTYPLFLALTLIAIAIMDSTNDEGTTTYNRAVEDERLKKARAKLNGYKAAYKAAYDVGTDEDRKIMRKHSASQGEGHPNVYKDLSKHAQTAAVGGFMFSGMEFDCPQCGPVQFGGKCPKTNDYHVKRNAFPRLSLSNI